MRSLPSGDFQSLLPISLRPRLCIPLQLTFQLRLLQTNFGNRIVIESSSTSTGLAGEVCELWENWLLTFIMRFCFSLNRVQKYMPAFFGCFYELLLRRARSASHKCSCGASFDPQRFSIIQKLIITWMESSFKRLCIKMVVATT